jgi:hypothetical protein
MAQDHLHWQLFAGETNMAARFIERKLQQTKLSK